jgi:hypothetical protein
LPFDQRDEEKRKKKGGGGGGRILRLQSLQGGTFRHVLRVEVIPVGRVWKKKKKKKKKSNKKLNKK